MTPEDIAYLRAQAQARGYNADDLLKVIQYESSGIANNWGGKNNNYYGLIQFGPNERKTYGIDTVHPSARNQIDGAMRFLADRGFKPGMGLLDLYSTVNAGSPGHYTASDGNGTVASHVAKMMGTPVPTGGQPASGGLDRDALTALAYSEFDKPAAGGADPIGELLQNGAAPKAQNPIAGLLSAAQPQQPEGQTPEEMQRDAFAKQMMDFHNAQHLRAIQGLL